MALKHLKHGTNIRKGLVVTEKNWKSLWNFIVGRGKGVLEQRSGKAGYRVAVKTRKGVRVAVPGDAIVTTTEGFEVLKAGSYKAA